MGYYLDLIFKSEETLDNEKIIDVFIQLGAVRMPREATMKPDEFVDLEWKGIPYPIVVLREPSKKIEGKWAYLRLSWSEDATKMKFILTEILEMAKATGCNVYDGQIQKYLTYDNIDEALLTFVSVSEKINGLLGKSQKKPNIN